MNIDIQQSINVQEFDSGVLEHLFQTLKKDNFSSIVNLVGSLRVNSLYRDTYDYFFNKTLFPNLFIQCDDIKVRFEDPVLETRLKTWFNTNAQYFLDWNIGQEITETFAKKTQYLECGTSGPLSNQGTTPTKVFSFDGLQNFINLKSFGQNPQLHSIIHNYNVGLYESQDITSIVMPPNLQHAGFRVFTRLPNITEVIFPATLSSMAVLPVTECDNCHLFMVGENMQRIDIVGQGFMWHQLYGLQTIVWLTPTPIPFTHPGYGTQITSVYVPDASVDAYKNTEGWSILSGSIKPVSTAPANIKQKILDNYNIIV